MLEKWTNTSSPCSREMKPKPFSALKNFTVPVAKGIHSHFRIATGRRDQSVQRLYRIRRLLGDGLARRGGPVRKVLRQKVIEVDVPKVASRPRPGRLG